MNNKFNYNIGNLILNDKSTMSIISTIINSHYGSIANFIIDKNEKLSLFNVAILNCNSNFDSLFIINGNPSILTFTRIKFENVSIENDIGTIIKSNVDDDNNNNNNMIYYYVHIKQLKLLMKIIMVFYILKIYLL